MIKYPKTFGYKHKFRNMEDVYKEYRSRISYGDEYKSHESKTSYGGFQREFQKTEHLREQQPVSERKSIDDTKQINAEIKNDEPSGPRQLPIVELGEKKFFLDDRLQELRDTENPGNSISFKDLDLIPEKTEQENQYEIKNQADVKEAFDLPKYENDVERQPDTMSRRRPSPYDKTELRW